MPVLSGSAKALVAAALVAAMLAAMPGAARPADDLEFAVKASYLTKFGPFVAWPSTALPNPAASFRICVVGSDPFGAELDQVAHGQRVQGHPLSVVHMPAVDAQSAATCQIMFVGQPTGQPTAATLAAVANLPVLTVTDDSRGVDGGIIEFVMQDDRVKFDINEAEASRAGLQISSKLLALALKVSR